MHHVYVYTYIMCVSIYIHHVCVYTYIMRVYIHTSCVCLCAHVPNHDAGFFGGGVSGTGEKNLNSSSWLHLLHAESDTSHVTEPHTSPDVLAARASGGAAA